MAEVLYSEDTVVQSINSKRTTTLGVADVAGTQVARVWRGKGMAWGSVEEAVAITAWVSVEEEKLEAQSISDNVLTDGSGDVNGHWR
jgi:hypothetical protein